MDLKIFLWILFGALLSTIPIILINKYIKSKQFFLLLISLLCYILVIVCYIKIFQKGNVITYYVIMKLISDILVIYYGIFFFNQILNIKQKIGLMLALISVYLISS
jgi:drug/metabolite transporter (DMT)-like permease